MSDNNLRNKLIRIAHANPELRKDLLPLIQKKALDDGFLGKSQLKKHQHELYKAVEKTIQAYFRNTSTSWVDSSDDYGDSLSTWYDNKQALDTIGRVLVNIMNTYKY